MGDIIGFGFGLRCLGKIRSKLVVFPKYTYFIYFIFSKEILKKLVEKKQAEIRKVHPGLTCFKEGITEIPVESIPGLQVSFIHLNLFVKICRRGPC